MTVMENCATCNRKITNLETSDNVLVDISDKYGGLHEEIPDEACYDDTIIKEWLEMYAGDKTGNSESWTRRIEKVPPLIRKDREDYSPRVVSLGPYHHGKQDLQLAENLKTSFLHKFVLGSGKDLDYFYNYVLEVIDDVRSCYVEGSTNDYNDKEFAQLMLLDGCFVLYFIECMSHQRLEIWQFVDHLGMLASKYLISDLFLLENQLPFQVLDTLMSLKYSENERRRMINDFFAIMFAMPRQPQNKHSISPREGQIQKQPLHLLEAFRTTLLSNYDEDKQMINSDDSSSSSSFKGRRKELPACVVKEDVQSFIRPVTELKAKGIQFKRSGTARMRDIKFISNYFYGQLNLPPRLINPQTKIVYLNLIAYEMCPRTPNDFGITSYISFMKSLIDHPDDVKELRSKGILINCLGSDEDVVKMYKDIATYDLQNFDIYDTIREDIRNHYNHKKTWMAELVNIHFSSPWTGAAFLAATSLLLLSFLQTYLALYPPSDKCMESVCHFLEGTAFPNHH